MSEQLPEIDPVIFEESMSIEFGLALTSQVERYVRANEIVENQGRQQGTWSSTEQIGDILDPLVTQLRESGAIIAASEIVITEIGDDTDESTQAYSIQLPNSRQDRAKEEREESSKYLVAYVLGLHTYITKQLNGLIETDRIPERSWELTWKKTRDIIKSMGGGNLADVADFFDALVELAYPQTFDPMARSRGSEVSTDVSARTFYKVMEPHLKRATIRQGKDNWR